MSNRGAGEQLGIVKARIPAPVDRRPAERDGAVDLPVPVVRDAGGRARRHDLANAVNAGHWGPGRSATTSHPQGR